VANETGLYDTAVEMAGVMVPAGVDAFRTNGYSVVGDGGAALYKRVISEPAHAGKVQTLEGAWWELVPDLGRVNVLCFAGGDIGAKFNAAVAYVVAVRQNSANTQFPDTAVIVIPAGTYTSTTTMEVLSAHNLVIEASGAVIRNLAGAHTVFKCIATGHMSVRGLKIDLRNNNLPSEAILLAGSNWHATFTDVGVQANTSNTNFAAVCAKQGNLSGFDDNDRNKGNFWTTFERFSVVRYSGADPNTVPVGIDLQGCSNAFRAIDCRFHGGGVGVLIRNQNGSATSGISNDVQLHYCAFEGGSAAVKFTSTVAAGVSGGSIFGCRFETMGSVLDVSGMTGSTPAPLWLAANTIISSTTNYVVGNANHFTSLDTSITPAFVTARLNNYSGAFFQVAGGAKAAVRAHAVQSAGGGSVSLERTDGTVDGLLSQKAGGGMDINSPSSNNIRISGLKGIASGGIHANNLRGTVATPASGNTVAVTLSPAEPDASYYIWVEADRNQGSMWVTSKATGGFTINSEAAFTSGGTINWLLVR
jgi:hypothetical protein